MAIGYLCLLFAGLFAGVLLLLKVPKLEKSSLGKPPPRLSIIIPARNEGRRLPFILKDLMRQSIKIQEIICVDDCSEDNTGNVVKNFDVKYIKVGDKPAGWLGKTWACQIGAKQAKGELLLFLDADLRLGCKLLENLIAQYQKSKTVISVQPYHNVSAGFEQFAFFFNAIGLAANGAAFPFAKSNAGLFGPLILISKVDFERIKGFEQVKQSIIEDVMLGKILKKANIKYQLLVGDKNLSFKMYANFYDLFCGFVKNFASGAFNTPIILNVLSFLWVHTLTATPLLVIKSIIQNNGFLTAATLFLYLIIVLHLIIVSPKIGSFKKSLLLIYPALLVVFHCVFFYSLYSLLFKKKVVWKEREITL